MSGTTLPTDPAVSVAQFRQDFPAFDLTIYTEDQVLMFLLQGTALLDPMRWGAMYSRGVELYVAHQLALTQLTNTAAQSGGFLGGIGLAQSKSIGKASVSYNYNFGMIDGAGPWNMTIFGREFYYWLRLFGMGGLQLTGMDGPFIPLRGFAGGWTGPHLP